MKCMCCIQENTDVTFAWAHPRAVPIYLCETHAGSLIKSVWLHIKTTKGNVMNDVNNDKTDNHTPEMAGRQILGIPESEGLPTKDTSVFTQSQEQVGDESEVAA